MSVIFMYAIARAQGSRMRLSINDVPILRGRVSGHRMMQASMNDVVVPGENVIDIEIEGSPAQKEALMFRIERSDAPDDPPVDFSWSPASAGGTSGPPSVIRARFFADTTFEPVFRRAEPSSFDCRGTPEQHEVLRRLHQALELRRADAFLESVSVWHDALYRAYDRPATYEPSAFREEFEEFFRLDTETRPLDLDELHFESRAGGRVAYVTRYDDEPAIDAFASLPEDDTTLHRFSLHPRMTRVDGEWRLF